MRFMVGFQRIVFAGLACLSINAPSALCAETAPTLEQMIGQMLIVGFSGTEAGDAGVEAVRQQLAEGVIGGVILLDRNIRSPEQLRGLSGALNPADLAIPAFISVDQEGGRVQRLAPDKGFNGWDSADGVRQSAETGAADFTLRYYTTRAKALHAVGVNLNFAPVVDLNINPKNPIIGRLGRSFSKQSAVVSALAADFVRGHRANGVLTSIKHFPGHGSSTDDSHKTLPSISKTWQDDELGPYRALARQNLIDMAMMGHLFHPDFSDAAGRPSSISRKGVQALRAIIGDTAVIVTDDLQMQAVRALYPDAEAAVQAVLAGNDVLLFSTYKQPDAAIGTKMNAAIRQAVQEGRITEQRIAESYYRILRIKQQM